MTYKRRHALIDNRFHCAKDRDLIKRVLMIKRQQEAAAVKEAANG